ncbi:hypothetical protein I7I51_07980 [Histoplasma capsulatum]|uniref:protein-serine/threonine phosphatase n=1 Tax=Ajellomyces capsulatus TaxID=5037 RepID=A0A8A1M191_AJECA|nr:hypothetical protein I7I51_07980 [Histoplasma capsulatum]
MHGHTAALPPPHVAAINSAVYRGKQSLETICLLLAYKIKYPENFFILRGNHECASINRIYGFYDEYSPGNMERSRRTKYTKACTEFFLYFTWKRPGFSVKAIARGEVDEEAARDVEWKAAFRAGLERARQLLLSTKAEGRTIDAIVSWPLKRSSLSSITD